MGGRDAQRGFIFQSIIAIIECLDRDDWDEVKVEPDTVLDKVDIQLYCDGKIKSAIQVKSSINKFGLPKVKGWLAKLEEDAPDAEDVRLYLVGDSFTEDCEKYIDQNSNKIKKISFNYLIDICMGKIHGYVKKACPGEDVRVKDLDQIEANLFTGILGSSITQGRLSRDDFEEAFCSVLGVRLYERLMSVFANERKEHPSIRMMDPDPNLFPKGLLEIKSDNRLAVVDKESPRAIKDMILDSWKRDDKRHILLVGEGGIGKTVAMLTLPEEKWFRKYRIPAIYVPLQRLDMYEGRLNSYIREKFGADYDRIIELTNRDPKGHPRLLLLLDGFNEIPDKYKGTAEKFIREWMGRAGVQIIMTSRLGFMLENRFSKYQLQTLPYETVESFLLSAGIKKEHLPNKRNPIWKVLNIPLMLTLYTQIDKVKDTADSSSVASLLDWREADNAAHIIWNYLQTELYHYIDKTGTSISLMQYVTAILLVAPYVCCQMSYKMKFHIDKEELQGLIKEALSFYGERQNIVSRQFLSIRRKYDQYSEEDLFRIRMASDYSFILVDNIALFQEQEIRNEKGKAEYTYSLIHKNFRDALAAFFIGSCLLKVSDSSEKKLLLDYADHYVKNYIAEFLSDKEMIGVWEKHRKEEPEDGHITFILMDIIGRQRNYDYRELDFSQIDLTQTNIHSLISKRMDICPLSEDSKKFKNTKISLNCLSSDKVVGRVNSVTYNPDGNHLASGIDDSTVRIWDLKSGESHVLEEHTGRVYCVVYSPDGRYLASGASDGTVRIWDLKSGESRVLAGDVSSPRCIAYSPNGKHLASGASDGTIWIWDLESAENRSFKLHTGEIKSVAYSPDGKYLASVSGGTVWIWDLESSENRSFILHTGGINSVAYSPDGRRLAGGTVDSTVQIWNLESGDSRILKSHGGWINSVVFSPDGKHLACGAFDGTVQIWNLESEENGVLKFHIVGTNSVAYSIDGRYLACGSDDNTVFIWDQENNQVVSVFGIIPRLNLSGANFELAEIANEDKEALKAAGVELQYQIHYDSDQIFTSINPNQIERFFDLEPSGCYNVDTFLDFLQKNNTDSMRMLITEKLHYLFGISEIDNSIVYVHKDLDLQQLLYQVWLIDTSNLNEPEIVVNSSNKLVQGVTETENEQSQDSQEKTEPHEELDSKTSPENQQQASSVPTSADVEEATCLVVKSFQEWFEQKLVREGKDYRIIQQTGRQSSGEQYGYDVGFELQIGEATFKVGFECKDYTSNINDSGRNSNINARAYAINLLKYFINSKPEINNRWVLINPFGNLQNDYPDKLFETWNRHHSYMRIFAITENQSDPTCTEFFSVDDSAYRKVYPDSALSQDKENKKDKIFSYIYKTVIGEDYVSKEIKNKLKWYCIPKKFPRLQMSQLLSVRTKDGDVAIEEVLRYLIEIDSDIKSGIKKNGIYIIGEYGSGKTWLLYQTIVEIVNHPAQYHFVPVLMRLKELYNKDDDEKDIHSIAEQYVDRVLEQQDQIEEYSVQDLRPVFLLDGFDEVLSGLSATNNKIKILLAVRDELNSRYRSVRPVFIVTSRESDFHACRTNKEFLELFGQFYKITLEDCPVSEAKEKLREYSERADTCKESVAKLIENPDVLELARRPVFYALLTWLIESGSSDLEGVVDEFSLLNLAVENEISRIIKEAVHAKGDATIDKKELSQALLEALFSCAIYCTQNNVDEAPITFLREELADIIPAGIVSVKNKSVEFATPEKPWKFTADQHNEHWVRFLHNIVREFIVAKKFFALIDDYILGRTEDKSFLDMLNSVQMSPASLRFFLIFLQRSTKEEEYKEKIKNWLRKPEIKEDFSLSTKLLEILLQPNSILDGKEQEPLDLSGIHTDGLCIWNCTLQHLNFREACLHNMQMTDTKLFSVDFRGADLSGLRIAPSKPIIDFCYWKQNREWNIAVLYQNGQVLKYSFTDLFMKDPYYVKLLPQFEGATGLFCISDEPYIIISGKTIYPFENKNILYEMSSRKSIQRIISKRERNCILVQNGEENCRAQIIDKKSLISHDLGISESNYCFLTKGGTLVFVSGNALKLVSQTGETKTLEKWESKYECFTIQQKNSGENIIFIKNNDHLIQIICNEQFDPKSTSNEYNIKGICGMMREICVIKDDTLVGIGETDLYIMRLETNAVIVEKVNTAVEATNVLLENEDGSGRMQDQEAYALITGTMKHFDETNTGDK